MAHPPQLAPLPRDSTREEIAADLQCIRDRARASRVSLVRLLAGIALILIVAAVVSVIR